MTQHDPHDWDEHAAWYNRVADHFEPEYSKATHAMLDAVGAGRGMRLLDLACGPGHTTAAAHQRGADALGIDTSRVMIDAARSRFPECRFEIGDMSSPPRGPWDAIVCRMGAHHAPPAWAEAAWEVLEPGGRLAIAELGEAVEQDHGNGMREPEAWGRLLERAGFVDRTWTTRTVRLGTIARSLPELADGGRSHYQNRPIHIISGRKPVATR